jgi:hypothetical protein
MMLLFVQLNSARFEKAQFKFELLKYTYAHNLLIVYFIVVTDDMIGK